MFGLRSALRVLPRAAPRALPLARRDFAAGVPDFSYKPLFSLTEPDGAAGGDHTVYRKLTGDYVEKVNVNGKDYLRVDGAGMRLLAKQAMVRRVLPWIGSL
jgi:hypothetical protein